MERYKFKFGWNNSEYFACINTLKHILWTLILAD